MGNLASSPKEKLGFYADASWRGHPVAALRAGQIARDLGRLDLAAKSFERAAAGGVAGAAESAKALRDR